MSAIKVGFDHAIHSAKRAAQRGDRHCLGRQLAAAHALAVWADTSLLGEYQTQETEVWREYESWKKQQSEEA